MELKPIKKPTRLIPVFLVITLIWSCEIGPKPIEYGSDKCQFCSMTIVDKGHAAEYVTAKGKVYRFDASECMANFLRDRDGETAPGALFLVNDFDAPGTLIDATHSIFLHSEAIPSPMGGNLTAFGTVAGARTALQNHGGKLLSWDELLDIYDGKKEP